MKQFERKMEFVLVVASCFFCPLFIDSAIEAYLDGDLFVASLLSALGLTWGISGVIHLKRLTSHNSRLS